MYTPLKLKPEDFAKFYGLGTKMNEFRCRGKLKSGKRCNRLLMRYEISKDGRKAQSPEGMQYNLPMRGEIKCSKCKELNTYVILGYSKSDVNTHSKGLTVLA